VTAFLPKVYSESVQRLAVGIEPFDAIRGRLAPRPVDVTFDKPAIPEWQIDRHRSGRFAIRYARGFKTDVAVRILEARRRYVPRRISFPIVPLATITTAEASGTDEPAAGRVWRPALFPGAAYDTPESATGVRGRVARADAPMRWARVEARPGGAIPADPPEGHSATEVIGRAHGDDRGDFLLILGGDVHEVGDLAETLEIEVDVKVYGPAAAPVPPKPPPTDPLWDLPLETATGAAAAADPPATYTKSTTRTLTLPLGRITSVREPFVIP
jgi:hypothetical protein